MKSKTKIEMDIRESTLMYQNFIIGQILIFGRYV